MNYKELMNEPNGVIFQLVDYAAAPLLQKVETVENDIIVRAFDYEFEQSRYGFQEMDETDKNSLEFHVFDKAELTTLNEYFTLAYLTK